MKGTSNLPVIPVCTWGTSDFVVAVKIGSIPKRPCRRIRLFRAEFNPGLSQNTKRGTTSLRANCPVFSDRNRYRSL
jgi:hypothetical protein